MSARHRDGSPPAEPPAGTVTFDPGDLASVVLSLYALRGAPDQFAETRASKLEARERLKRLLVNLALAMARTGGGGLHVYFRHPGAGVYVKNQTPIPGWPGIDSRGDGGYVLAPPSTHISGAAYVWRPGRGLPEDLTTLPELPAESSSCSCGRIRHHRHRSPTLHRSTPSLTCAELSRGLHSMT